jgi:hypothetical protein
MRSVLAGPTTEGSYVISIWVPVPPRLTPDEDLILFDLGADLDPYPRAATRHLNTAVFAAHAAAQDFLRGDEGLDAFVHREAQGVSANLCEALASLSGENEEPFSIRFAWALDRPVIDLPAEARFESPEVPILSEAARELRAQQPEGVVHIRGNVVRLHREGQLGAGEVTIAGVVIDDPNEKLRRVTVSLAEADYQQAITAHERYFDVEIDGTMLQRGTRTHLVEAAGFVARPPAD